MINQLMRSLGSIPRDYALLAVLAFGVYLPGYWWGAPHATGPERVQSWGVDDGTPLQPLADIHNIIQPKPDRYFGYPLMHSFVITGAYAPYLGYLYLTGQFRPATGYPFGLVDPVVSLRTLSRIAHFMSVLFGVGMVVCAYDAARTLWNPHTGTIAALFALSMYPMFYYARAGNPDGLMMFFFAGSIAALARIDEAAREVIQGWEQRRPEYILLLPDHSSSPGEPYSATCPPQVYAALTSGRLGYRLAAQFETDALLPWVRRPTLDYPTVNPPVRIFARNDLAAALPPKGKPD